MEDVKSQKNVVVDESTPGGRVAWLLRKIWRGSQSRMAEDTGVSQSAISNVVAAKRTPGRRMLTTVSAHPLVNATWLLTGEGEPLIAEEQPSRAGGHFCSIADGLLPGAPGDHREQLTGQYRPVAAPQYSEHRYWLQINTENFTDMGLVPGDWLLMDTDGSWLKRPKLLVGQPCVVLEGTRAKPTLVMLFLRYDPEAKPAGKHAIDVLAANTKKPEPPSSGRKARNVRIRTEARKTKTAVGQATHLIPLKNIVAVAVQAERRWP